MERQAAMETLDQVLGQIERDCELMKQQESTSYSQDDDQQQKQPELSQRTLLALSSLLPTVLAAALQILDEGKVTKFVSKEAQRHFYRVKESKKQSLGSEYAQKGLQDRTMSGAIYFDVLSNNCFCYFSAKQTLSEKGSSLVCKHVLAAKLAQALSQAYPNKLTVKEIDDIDF